MDILKVSSSLNTKNPLPVHQHVDTAENFNIADLTKITKTNTRSEEFRQTDDSKSNDGFDISNQLNIPTKSLYSADVLKNLLSDDFLKLLTNSTSPDTVNTFNEFSKNIFLDESSLSGDMQLQQKSQTCFEGSLFDSLRTIYYKTKTGDVKSLIVNMLKNIASLSSQESIVLSVKNNIIYLSQLLKTSPSLSQSVLQLAEKFTLKNLESDYYNIKDTAYKILESASKSIIATDEIKELINLIKYNLSKYNDNPALLQKSFENILKTISDKDVEALLKEQYSQFLSQFHTSPAARKQLLSSDNNFKLLDSITYSLSDNINKHLISQPLSDTLKQLQIFSSLINKTNTNQSSTDIIFKNIELIKSVLKSVSPNSCATDVEKLADSLVSSKDLDSLIQRLQYIIDNTTDNDVQLMLSKLLNPLLTNLSQCDSLSYHPPSSLQYLCDFLNKALGNENIPLLGIVDPDTLVSSMLTSPGFFTPLLHYVLPLQCYNLQAFGEVWINNPTIEKGEPNDDNINHIFLTFDINNVGIFELELKTLYKNIGITLFFPPSLSKIMTVVKSNIKQIIKNNGYNVSSINVSELRKVRTLPEVFPHLNERRKGINAKI